MSVYTDNGFEDREDYLTHLAEDLELDLITVTEVANLLGEDEDFDGLVTTLEDWVE